MKKKKDEDKEVIIKAKFLSFFLSFFLVSNFKINLALSTRESNNIHEIANRRALCESRTEIDLSF